MKNPDPEDEAFEELALKQGHWQHTSGWRKKQIQEPSMTDKEAMADPMREVQRLGQEIEQERNFCPRCGKRTKDLTHIHTCTPPPQEKT